MSKLAQEMASLFDVDIEKSFSDTGESSDYGTTIADKPVVAFDKKIEDVKSVMEPAPTKKQPKEVNLKQVVKSVPVTEIATKTEPELTVITTIEEAKKVPPKTSTLVTENQNPLGLTGDLFRIYQQLHEKYPQFTFSGSPEFHDFYRSKFYALKTLIEKFGLLDIVELREELNLVKLDHFIDKDVVHTDLLRRKIDDTYKCRTRVSHLLVTVYGQYFMWRRWCEMLQSKLWKDHGQRGAHAREGLTLEHMVDIDMFVQEMEGFLESAKQVDQMLKAASDSLSRQLTCMQIKEPRGLSDKHADDMSAGTENLDVISDGAMISAPEEEKKAIRPIGKWKTPEDDEIANLGK